MTKGHRLGALSSSFFPRQFWEESENKVSARVSSEASPWVAAGCLHTFCAHTPVEQDWYLG